MMKHVALVLALAAAGCQGASQTSGIPGVRANSVDPAHGHALLYVDSGGGTIEAFRYPQGKPAGQIVQNYGADGMCSDKVGNIYVAVPDGYELVVYPHGGIFPIYVLSEANEGVLPSSCATDAKSGDLAVTNFEGSVEIYKNATGKPQGYALGLDEAFFATYDNQDNLFVTGEHNGSFVLAELPAGSGSAKAISINAGITPGYGIAWNGKNLVLQSADASGVATLLTVKVSGSSGTVVRTTTLMAGANSTPTEFMLDGHTVVEPEDGNADVGFWTYPSGGAPTKTLQNVGAGLIGITLSR